MNIKLLQAGLFAPVLLSGTVLVAGNAQANDGFVAVDTYNADASSNMASVTSVSQLSDVRPTDWAFQALQSLVERYGCIAGYPDKTYRGNRAMSRYEFAAGLNACMDRVNELIAAATNDLAKKEDLETLKKLQEEFAAELATLRGRVDSLESKVATLEKQQFSTTTKLRGEVIFALSGALGNNKANSLAPVDENTTFAYRARLGFSTSFNGKDQLFTRLQARNTPNWQTATGTNMTRSSFEGGAAADGSVAVDKLYYRFPFAKAQIQIDAIGGEFYNNVENFNPGLASDAQGALSRFGRFNPIYRYGQGGAGATVKYPLSDQLEVGVGFLADEPAVFGTSQGIFNGSNGTLAQIAFKPSKELSLGLTYVRGYDRAGNVSATGATGSVLANRPFGNAAALKTDNFGLEGSFRLNPSINIAGWAGLTRAYQASSTNDATLLNWAVALSFPDAGKKGSLASVIFGMPPKVTKSDTIKDANTSYHLEALYRYQLNDKISVTPGMLVIFNPEHNTANDTEYVGTVRTTFSF
jgi:hypothetical protein